MSVFFFFFGYHWFRSGSFVEGLYNPGMEFGHLGPFVLVTQIGNLLYPTVDGSSLCYYNVWAIDLSCYSWMWWCGIPTCLGYVSHFVKPFEKISRIIHVILFWSSCSTGVYSIIDWFGMHANHFFILLISLPFFFPSWL